MVNKKLDKSTYGRNCGDKNALNQQYLSEPFASNFKNLLLSPDDKLTDHDLAIDRRMTSAVVQTQKRVSNLYSYYHDTAKQQNFSAKDMLDLVNEYHYLAQLLIVCYINQTALTHKSIDAMLKPSELDVSRLKQLIKQELE